MQSSTDLLSRLEPFRGRLEELGLLRLDELAEQFELSIGGDDPAEFLAWLQMRGELSVEQFLSVHEGGRVHTSREAPRSPATPLYARYDLLGAIGRGGMGEVRLARQLKLQRVVAVKVMTPEAALRPALKRRFWTEAQITAQLDHPNVVPIYSFESAGNGNPAFSMKLVRGRTFSAYIDACLEARQARGPLPEEFHLHRRLEHFLKVCDALAYAHSRGVLHRDLKPDNLMLGPWGEVYVMDWGIAKIVGVDDPAQTLVKYIDEEHQPGATRVGESLGTPAYMSPEQANGRIKELGPASDLYSLGLILFEMVALARARSAVSALHAISRAREGELDELRHASGRSLPRDLEAIVRRATATEPVNRYSSVGELAEDVRRFMQGDPVSVRRRPIWQRAWRWLTRHPVIVVTLLAALLLSAAGTVVASLTGVVVVQERSARQERVTTALTAQVIRRSHEIDTELLTWRSLMDSLAQAIIRLHDSGQDRELEGFYSLAAIVAGEAPEDMAPVERYRQRISFSRPAYLLAPSADRELALAELGRLSPVAADFRRTLLRSHSEEAATWPSWRAERQLRGEGVPAQWVYVGFETGAYAAFPTNDTISDGYDPRERPWYSAAIGSGEPFFGDVYPDDSGSGLLLPASRALYTDSDELIGVMGLDIHLDTLVRRLDLDLPGLTDTWLVDGAGKMVVRSDLKGAIYGPGLHGNTSLEREPLPVEQVREDIVRGEPYGVHRIGRHLVAYNHIPSVDWYYVVRGVEAELPR